jgi:protein ImuA
MATLPDQRAQTERPALAALKAELRRLEGAGRREQSVRPIGVAGLEQGLPGGGLARGALHEIVAGPGGAAAAEGFAASLLAGLVRHGPVLWCTRETGLYGPGLARLGLAPDRLILVSARRPADLLWAMEEGLKTPGLAAVLGEPERFDLTASRRLQLAAEASGVTCLVLRREHSVAERQIGSSVAERQIGSSVAERQIGSSVAVTRWRVTPVPSGPAFAADTRDFGLARARWRVELTRCRGADWAAGTEGHGVWLMEEGDASGAVAVAVPSADRSAATVPERLRA